MGAAETTYLLMRGRERLRTEISHNSYEVLFHAATKRTCITEWVEKKTGIADLSQE